MNFFDLELINNNINNLDLESIQLSKVINKHIWIL